MIISYMNIICCLLCIVFSFSTKPTGLFSASGWFCALLSQITIIGLKGAA